MSGDKDSTPGFISLTGPMSLICGIKPRVESSEPGDEAPANLTQHAGDEMYHPTLGGYSPEWSNEEV